MLDPGQFMPHTPPKPLHLHLVHRLLFGGGIWLKIFLRTRDTHGHIWLIFIFSSRDSSRGIKQVERFLDEIFDFYCIFSHIFIPQSLSACAFFQPLFVLNTKPLDNVRVFTASVKATSL